MTVVFQNFGLYPMYLQHLYALARSTDYLDLRRAAVNDRFVALHMLQPILSGVSGDFALGNDRVSQRSWARKKGMSRAATLGDILLAQIEDSKAEVFYNMDPISFDGSFVRRLPGTVRKKIGWRAAPGLTTDFGAYDLLVCNFESILQSFRDQGWNAAWFYPAFDPVMIDHRREIRKTDLVFVGSYSRHHAKRGLIVEALASLQDRHNIRIYIQQSRLTRLAGTALGYLPGLKSHRLPTSIRNIARPPAFGRSLYDIFGSTKIVINGAIDMSGEDRGNMRCWEALGCGALMLSDEGRYPPGFEDGSTMQTYVDIDDMMKKIDNLLGDNDIIKSISASGSRMIAEKYSKSKQWDDFTGLL